MERLDKLLAATGRWSRKEAKALIKAGRVQVAGERPAGPEDKVEPGTLVTVDGRPISTETYVYVMLNKPAGVISSTEDPREETVLSLLPNQLRRMGLFPVGRLDKDSEGLLLLTSDGEIVNRLLRAAGGHEKEYQVTVDRPVTAEFIRRMAAGVPVLDRMTLPCRVKKTGQREFDIVLVQGMNRQIRRMCEYLGYRVETLRRVRIMNLRLGEMQPGDWREATPAEMAELFRALEKKEAGQ